MRLTTLLAISSPSFMTHESINEDDDYNIFGTYNLLLNIEDDRIMEF
ncbi:hypothetical protein ACV566_09835 [Staphylococcus aureus]